MIRGLFRRSSSETIVRRLYGAVVDASRNPALYEVIGIPDTFEGRFESLTLHVALVLRRLQGCEAPGPALAQDLVDTTFAHFDRTLREMGVGDTTVPKRMKQLAEAFYGRSNAYQQALAQEAQTLARTLAATLARNTGAHDADALARTVAASAALLQRQPLQAFIDGVPAFADPAEAASVATSGRAS